MLSISFYAHILKIALYELTCKVYRVKILYLQHGKYLTLNKFIFKSSKIDKKYNKNN